MRLSARVRGWLLLTPVPPLATAVRLVVRGGAPALAAEVTAVAPVAAVLPDGTVPLVARRFGDR